MRICWVILAACLGAGCGGDGGLQRALSRGSGRIQLPPGVTEISRELQIPAGAQDLEIAGAPEGSTLRASARFKGKAILSIRSARGVRLRDFDLDGNRESLEVRVGLPPSDVAFVDYYSSNGIIADEVRDLSITNVRFRNMTNYALIVSRSSNVLVEKVVVRDSGSRNEKGRNNASGGMLFETGTENFRVLNSRFLNVRGNGVWTHSRYTSPRNRDGRIAGNWFERTARDAIQVGHATGVTVEGNTGRLIGYPVEEIDLEGGGIPVAIDTAGNVDNSRYLANRFEEINGKCIDLDGFHNGEVRGNECRNRLPAVSYTIGQYAIVMNNTNPDMRSENIVVAGNTVEGWKFGGIFLIGQGHTITGNRLLSLNKAGCNESAQRFGCLHFPDQPDLLQSGIYLGSRAERPDPARGNLVQGNTITGHRMAERCIGRAPGIGVADNQVKDNTCANK